MCQTQVGRDVGTMTENQRKGIEVLRLDIFTFRLLGKLSGELLSIILKDIEYAQKNNAYTKAMARWRSMYNVKMLAIVDVRNEKLFSKFASDSDFNEDDAKNELEPQSTAPIGKGIKKWFGVDL